MNGIYFSEGLNFSNKENIGIEKKVLTQIECLRQLGTVDVLNVEFKNNLIERILFILPFFSSDRERKRELLLDIVNEKTNYIYIRKPSLTIKFYKVLKKIKRKYPNIYIIMEIPTYPFHSEYSGVSKIMNLKSINCEKKLKDVVDKILTYSDDDAIWGIPTIKTSNCVLYDSITKRSNVYKIQKNTIRLTCVANFTYWHGLDRLINGIKEYKGNYNIVLNVVGGGREIENLKRISKGLNNVIFHGPKSGNELTNIFDNTDIAVDALGRHRSGVYFNSSLKGKEYVARGIPVISAVKTELDYMKDFKYYLKLPADESFININDVVDFYNSIYYNESEEKVTDFIRNYTQKFFDYEYGFKNVIKEELNLHKGK